MENKFKLILRYTRKTNNKPSIILINNNSDLVIELMMLPIMQLQ